MADSGQQDLVSRSRAVQQTSRASRLPVSLGDRAAEIASTSYSGYSTPGVKKAYAEWTRYASRDLEELLSKR